jgi:asparagine synthase (glutamine-hydrolysing)
MCGIVGYFCPKEAPNLSDSAALIEGMLSSIVHRGPDDGGVMILARAGLGHRRLSVIDLSSAGHQPMALEGGRFQIVFNGEIYNFPELRKELEKKGVNFFSHTDTEVILQGYIHWGVEVFQKLRGMFALAIFDVNANELILARDRVGKKPLFYTWHQGVFIFASEIKSILAWPGIKREPELEAIHHYLTYQYVPAPLSAFKGVFKIPQATYVVIRPNGNFDSSVYWSLPEPKNTKSRPAAQLKEELIELLDESVKIRMLSDVPLGAFLSGGVDSSAVVAMMARHSSKPIKTFCIGFDEAAYDERHYARMVSQRYGTDHEEMVVRPDAIQILPKIVWHYGEPFADPSAIPTFYVSEIARKSVTVALNGDGGDESFIGYSRYMQCLQAEWVSDVPKYVRRKSAQWANILPSKYDRYKLFRGLRRAMNIASENDASRYAPSLIYFSDQDKDMGYGELLRPYLHQSSISLLDKWFEASSSYVGGAAYADIHTYLPDDLLVKVDIASMAYSLEARSPLLDHHLMEWAAHIPVSQKLANGESKSLFKSTLEPFLPHEVLYRPKMGFGVPIDRWFRSELKEFAYDTLLSQKARQRGLIDPKFVETMLQEHCDEVRLHHTRLWGILMMELWYQMWIDPSSTPTLPTELMSF